MGVSLFRKPKWNERLDHPVPAANGHRNTAKRNYELFLILIGFLLILRTRWPALHWCRAATGHRYRYNPQSGRVVCGCGLTALATNAAAQFQSARQWTGGQIAYANGKTWSSLLLITSNSIRLRALLSFLLYSCIVYILVGLPRLLLSLQRWKCHW